MDNFAEYRKVRRKRTSEEISDALAASGMSKKEFASKMHRQPSEVTKWLSGNHNFTIDLLAEISCVLSTPISGVTEDGPLCRVDGYSAAPPSAAGFLSDCTYTRGLPESTLLRLKQKALAKGMTPREFVMNLITECCNRSEMDAFHFCGTVGDDFPDAEELRSARTSNRIHEL